MGMRTYASLEGIIFFSFLAAELLSIVYCLMKM